MNKKVFNMAVFDILNLFIINGNTWLHGREIARQLNKNQRIVQLNLNVLAQARILSFQTAGKSRQYTINLENPKSNAMLLMTECSKTIKLLKDFEIEQIIKDIKRITDTPFLVFGSYAKGYVAKDSDIDILTITNKKISTEKIQAIYTTRIHLMNISTKTFEKGIKNKDSFPMEVATNHVICQGYEYILDKWKEIYG
ncbi:MAG: nucleotidyltransferase domain-containing protein [Candidatus Aenigmarchaeota archaeon]|nr:nucleotidyltransferase domain-containing protein [Candidatus Aenigmarchaeota archaeon]